MVGAFEILLPCIYIISLVQINSHKNSKQTKTLYDRRYNISVEHCNSKKHHYREIPATWNLGNFCSATCISNARRVYKYISKRKGMEGNREQSLLWLWVCSAETNFPQDSFLGTLKSSRYLAFLQKFRYSQEMNTFLRPCLSTHPWGFTLRANAAAPVQHK